MLYIASDHGGFTLKEEIKNFLTKRNIPFSDLGPASLDPNDDYPTFAALVAKKISANPTEDVGILLCRSGQGVNIVANKFKGVRAALVWNTKEAIASRHDDFSNIVSLPTDHIGADVAENIIEAWLTTPWGNEERHIRRIKEIADLEETLYP